MKQLLYILLSLATAIPGATQSNLSGVINTYTSVLSIDYCTYELEVDNGNGFEPGENVLLFQTQGASINESNSASFGNITDIGKAGLYEKNTILAVTGNTITLQFALIHAYDPPNGLQLITMPDFADATVTETLSAQAWNGSTGGVLAFSVANTLTLQADIDLTGVGFRGGISEVTANNNCNALTNANNYFYDSGNWRGAPKGEGIVPIIPDKEMGRGAQANGGGGGNDHNSGGGGGGNLSPGGQGGRNLEPTTFGCDGNFPGIGGKALPTEPSRIYLGGGGGSGHENNNVGTDGGSGGGIILIEAQNIDFNGFSILANGATPAEGGGDGAGGGGGGGTVILLAQTLTDPMIRTNGGDGGLVNNGNNPRCMGPGGGGSGGRILSNQPLVAATDYQLFGGKAGLSINSSSCGDGTNEAANGANGIFAPIDSIPAGNQAATAPAIVNQPTSLATCGSDPLTISIETTGAGLSYQWQADTGNGFTDIDEGSQYTGTNGPELTINAPGALPAIQFQLVISTECAGSITSDPIQLEAGSDPTAAFTTDINGFTVAFNNLSEGAANYTWDFGDDQQSGQSDPEHTYPAPGEYTVSLTANNNCGSATTTLSITIAGAPNAAFDYTPDSGCAPLTVAFTNLTAGDVNEVLWFFPGGTPATSTGENPNVSYGSPGTYSATLIATNDIGVDTFTLADIIIVNLAATAGFEYSLSGLTAIFQNTSENADSYQWEVVETGFNSSEENPTYTFPAAGNYTVILTAENACGPIEITQTVSVGAAPSANFSTQTAGGCAPLYVQFTNESSGTFDSYEWSFPGGDPVSSTEAAPLIVYTEPGNYDVGLTVSGSLGEASILKADIVEVRAYPSVNFDYEIVGNTVNFTNYSSPDITYFWDFGDGITSQETNPSHTFAGAGAFDVTLSAQNTYCGRSITQTIFVAPNAVRNGIPGLEVVVYPNPFTAALNISVNGPVAYDSLEGLLFNSYGQLVTTFAVGNAQTIYLPGLPAGGYWLVIKNRDGSVIRKLIKQAE